MRVKYEDISVGKDDMCGKRHGKRGRKAGISLQIPVHTPFGVHTNSGTRILL